jgi:hypothetical protein
MNSVIFVEHGALKADFNVREEMRLAVQKCANTVGINLDALLQVLIDTPRFPVISKVKHSALPCRIRIVHLAEQLYNVVLEVEMPCSEARLLWMPWLPHQAQPERVPGEYQHINFGKWAVMPRRTKCYGHAYAFSGQTHPLEAETPAAISELYAETNRLFNLEAPGVNMCLENDYACGFEKISEHSDDERQFGALHDVFCWVTGPAARTAIFRVKSFKGTVPPRLHRLCCRPAEPEASRELFNIALPAGLYVMAGRQFQNHYSHEFPAAHSALYKRVLKAAAQQWGSLTAVQIAKRARRENKLTFPTELVTSSKGVCLTPLIQAAWLKENRAAVTQLIEEGGLKPQRGRTAQEDVTDFNEWCLERTSYTLRSFSY